MAQGATACFIVSFFISSILLSQFREDPKRSDPFLNSKSISFSSFLRTRKIYPVSLSSRMCLMNRLQSAGLFSGSAFAEALRSCSGPYAKRSILFIRGACGVHKTGENSSDETAKAVMFFDLLRSPYMFKRFTTIQNLF